ncbi:MAG TPA: cytochrome c biogenesis protein CcdA [Gemmataceae bacterium]|nr:cytochrome c biogenesis protein CcdA [Gemmataceae bacterium]
MEPNRVRGQSLIVGLIAVAALLLGSVAWAADTPGQPARPAKKKLTTDEMLRFSVAVKPEKVRRGQTVTVTVTGTPTVGYHTYPITQRTSKQDEVGLTRLTMGGSRGLKAVPGITEDKPQIGEGETLDGPAPFAEFDKQFQWSQDVLVLPDATPGKLTVRVKIDGQVCDASHCVPLHKAFMQTIEVTNDPPQAIAPAVQQRLDAGPPAIKVIAPPDQGSPAASKTKTASSGLWSFVLAGVFWGAISLITPCVFPMIPITVSFFLKQSEKEHHRPLTMAVVYCATIVIVLTIAAIAFLSFFRMLSTNWIMNLVLGGLFIFFALSLFGMYEIELPNGLARFTSSREGQGGLVGTMFMALTFTIISFACVAPFLGGFGGTAATSTITWPERILGGLAFSTTFAAPFFFLALFPSLLRALPKSGNWLNSVKVVMGFLEVAAAVKFLRTAEVAIREQAQIFTYDFSLGVYVALALLCGLYLLGVYRLPHDTPSEHLTVPRLMFSAAFLALGFYLTPGLFRYSADGENQRPDGVVFAWLDAFLLPNEAKGDLPWTADLPKALAEARSKSKLVFVDMTGVTCTNCNYNERTIFPQPTIKKLLAQYDLVKLYTDRVPNEFYSPDQLAKFGGGVKQQIQDALDNLAFQRRTFNTEQLPLYAVLKPKADGSFDIVATYEEGKITSAAKFAQFLSQPLSGSSAMAQVQGR